MTHNKYLTYLFLFFAGNDSISAKCAAQILSLNLSYTFLLLNFLITGLCNSSASCSFSLIPDPYFVSKTFWTLLANALWYQSWLQFSAIP